MDIAGWLRDLGMERYEAAFLENDVRPEILRHLTADDLKELGVAAVGHRRQLLVAIAELHRDGASKIVKSTDDYLGFPAAGERRQLTVMFCDLVGSTALGEKLDPEDLRGLLHAYRTLCGDIIARYDGFVARYLGDGILTYFGWPTAHEEDAERAVRAALEIVHTVRRASSTEDLSVRIGIATGSVVVGEPAGAGADSTLAVGSTPNLAARLQGLAAADQIVIAASTYRLVGNAFALTDLGEHDLKGIAEPVHAWRVERALLTESRFDAHRDSGTLTPLVGREEEVDLLLRRWTQAKDGEGQMVLLSGEPGIGKSRILSTLRQRLDAQGVQVLRFQCSPFFVNSAYWPMIDHLERKLVFGRDETADSKLDKLEALLVTEYGCRVADVRFVAAILSVPCDARYSALPMTPQKHKDETLRTLVDLIDTTARQQPSVLLFEDAHWADPTTLEVLDLLIDRVKTIPLLVVLTHRPEFQPRWFEQGHVGALNLSRLTRTQSTMMVSALTNGKALPAALLEQILIRTDGVPLFVEELTKSVLESGELTEADDHYEYGSIARTVTIPATLRDSLMARLDRFMPVKVVAQIGAAIGREFSYELIAAVAPMPQAQLDDSLANLSESGLAFRRGTPPDAIYTFKHALVQDAAYDSLLKSRRQELHGKIALAIETRLANTKTTTEPEVLAHHLTEAGLVEAAIEQWRKAGEKALRGSALTEAVMHLTRGIELVSSLPAAPERKHTELQLQLAVGTVMWATKGQSAPETLGVFSRARDLLGESATLQEQITVLYGLWRVHFGRSEHTAGEAVAEECLALATHHRDVEALALANRLAGETQWAKGAFARARYYLQQTLDYFPPDRDSANDLHLSHDHTVSALGWLGLTLWPLGYPEQSLAISAQAVVRARGTGHAMTIALALYLRALLGAAFTSTPEQSVADSDEAAQFCVEHGISHYEHWARFCQGIAKARSGDPQRGIEVMQKAMEPTRNINARLFRNLHLGHLAATYAILGKPEVGLNLLDEAILMVDKTQERLFEAELHRLRGELLFQAEGEGRAEAALEEALKVARRQGARLWEIRAATSIARLRRDQGRRIEAYDLLAPIYSGFTEGYKTKDLKDAKAVLDELT